IGVTTARVNIFGDVGVEYVIRNNGFNGVSAGNNATVSISGAGFIQNNGFNGVGARHNSTLTVDSAVIEGNGQWGIDVGETSHGEVVGPLTVRNNGTPANAGNSGGVRAVENSDVYIDGGVQISNNNGPGVLVDIGGVLSSLGG